MDTEYYRQLASVQEIVEILPHNNADKLELATVMGWQVVIVKGSFLVGDRVIYLEIDSICPVKPWSEFLTKCNYRIKTIKLRKELSQGLILPLSVLEESDKFNTGDDVTTILGITKYMSPEDGSCNPQGNARVSTFPSHLGMIKTDEPRIQSSLKFLDRFKGLDWYATVKYDGTSATYLLNPLNQDELLVCSRNQTIDKPDIILPNRDFHWYVAEKYDLVNVLKKIPGIVIQGEIYGPKIQKNKLNVDDLMLAVFTTFNLQTKCYGNMHDIVDHCNILGLDMVKIGSLGDKFDFTKNELLEMVRGKYPDTKNDREGMVFRLQDTVYLDGNRMSFKVINNDFLLKE
jgi:RNA ligase (TIGR02306 family)